MIIRDKLRPRYPRLSNEEWRRQLRRELWKKTIFYVSVWAVTTAFTVWLLWR